jgi:sialate O-acetylesterase
MKRIFSSLLYLSLALFFTAAIGVADVKTSGIFGDSMVMQRDIPLRVWGWTKANIDVRVTLARHVGVSKSDSDGRFEVTLDPLPAGGPHQLVIEGDETLTFEDVLIGEVWICSGASNMTWPVASSSNGALELLTSKYPNLRLMTIPHVGAEEPQERFEAEWVACTPLTAKYFSGVGYYFGRQLHLSLEVPVGLIENSWPGSTIEAWIGREELESIGEYDQLLEQWSSQFPDGGSGAGRFEWDDQLSDWEVIRRRSGTDPMSEQFKTNARPASIYNGVLHPLIGYGIRGAIWYQGESDTERADQYRELFPLMIESWRRAWGLGDFPFYWAQLANFGTATDSTGSSRWAELREAQTMTSSKLPNTGQVVTTDLGEATEVHPANKRGVANRLARWALSPTYGFSNPLSPGGGLARQSPILKTIKFDGRVATLRFEHPNGGMSTPGDTEPVGFAIAGEDRVFVNARAKIVDVWGTVLVWSDEVGNPVAIRYAWADNPISNLSGGFPVTPFRTDDW